jgi:hypothetical protein
MKQVIREGFQADANIVARTGRADLAADFVRRAVDYCGGEIATTDGSHVKVEFTENRSEFIVVIGLREFTVSVK